MLTVKAAKLVGVVVKGNKKILGSTFSTNPNRCNVGQKLIKVVGSTCNKCYAVKLSKVYPSALASWENNLNLWLSALQNDPMSWIESMVYQIGKISANKAKKGELGANLHRWFAAGDIPSLDGLRSIIEVCKLTPEINHWLPTREKGLINSYLAANPQGFPTNLNVRLSAAMIDGPPLNTAVSTSTVHTKGAKVYGVACPAIENHGNCGTCVQCWASSVKNISYQKH
jgi:hypothetical protein